MTAAADAAPGPNDLVIGVACGLLAALIWGAFMAVSALGLEAGLSAPDMTALRAVGSGAMMLPVILFRWRVLVRSVGLGKLLVLTLGAGPTYSLLVIGGLLWSPASHGTVIVPGAIPVITALLSVLILAARPSGRGMIGLALVVAGVVLLGVGDIGLGGTGPGHAHGSWQGTLLFLGAATAWSLFTVLARFWRIDPLSATAGIAGLSALLYGVPYLAVRGQALLEIPGQVLVFQAVFHGVAIGFFALFCYAKAVWHLGAPRAGLFPALVPGVGLLLTIPLLGEAPTLWTWIGMGIVTLGMVLAIQPARPSHISHEN